MRVRSLFSVSILLFVTAIVSCKKEVSNNIILNKDAKEPTFEDVVIDGNPGMLYGNSLSGGNLNKMAFSEASLLSSAKGNKIGAVHIKNNQFWTDGSRPGLTIDGYADEFIMIPEWLGRLDVFHLGSLIRGNSLQDLSFVPLSEREGHYEARPIYASVSFPAKKVFGSYVPDIMATSEFFSTLMQQNGLPAFQNSAFKYEIKEFNYYDEVKTVFGSNVDIKALFYKSGSSGSTVSDHISKGSGLVASFTQENFSVDMDTPEPGELFDKLNIGLLNDVWPAYINSVIYGSKGILLIESEQESEVLKTTFNKAFSVMGGLVSGTQTLTSNENKVIQNADLQLFFTGPTGETVVKKLTSFDELIGFIKTGTTFSPSAPGVPIAFKMRSLNTHKTIVNNFSIRIAFNPFYIKEEFILDPNIPSAPRHELRLSFFADTKGRIPINVPNGTAIYVDTKFVRMVREGSHRTGFTMQAEYDPAPHFNVNQGHIMTLKPVLLINSLSSSPDGSYRKVGEKFYVYKPQDPPARPRPERPDRSPR